jgi:RNA polymerase sigma factor (sigma-70 family)
LSTQIRVEVRVKSLRLYEWAQAQGSAKRAAEVAGVPYLTLLGYIGLRERPWTFRRQRNAGPGLPDVSVKLWKETAVRLATVVGVTPEELFPEKLFANAGAPRPDHFIVDAAYMLPLSEARQLTAGGPHEVVERLELAGMVEQLLQTLPRRRAQALRMAYGIGGDAPAEQNEIAEELGITPARVSQILAKALRQLRHPSRSRKLARWSA